MRSSITLDIAEFDHLNREIALLRKLLVEAADDISTWGEYAGDYFAEKHGLAENIKKYRDAGIGLRTDSVTVHGEPAVLLTHIRPSVEGDPVCYAWQVCATGDEGAVAVYHSAGADYAHTETPPQTRATPPSPSPSTPSQRKETER